MDTKVSETIKHVPTSGPSITQKEVDYVLDAVQNGWYANYQDYIQRFERAFAEFLGVDYAISTSSCTGAMHIALAALGVGPGAEVIVPELTWVATASAVVYLGATPVIVDVDEDTWCIDPESVRRAITDKTKAIIPVDCYGHPVAIDELLQIAREHGLYLFEDAAPSIGSKYNGERPGHRADMAAFSFQGAKIMVTGEGGMLTTNNEDLYRQAYLYWDHGRDPSKTLFNKVIGLKYKMSNLLAALGLAQLERIDELVDKKRQIFGWYQERLSEVKGLVLNSEGPDVYNNFTVSSCVLKEDFAVSRDECMAKLKERGIDTRPFFHPLSSLPMFEDRSAQNPVSYGLSRRGFNLPCAHNLTEAEADYVATTLKDILLGR